MVEQEVRETTTQSDGVVQKTTEVNDPNADSNYHQTLAERIVWFIAGVIVVLLGFRLLLSLLGANTSNPFANFIYTASHPFVAPFFSLFSYNNIRYGVSRFEVYTVVAIIFYIILAWGIVKLVTIARRND